MIQTIKAFQGETIYDLTIRAYGDIKGLPYFLKDNPSVVSKLIPALVETEYFQIDLTPAVGKTLELTSIDFEISSRVSIRPVRNFALAYSLNVDFTESVNVINYPEGDLSTSSIPDPVIIDLSFSSPIIVADGETIYFRIYFYNAHDSNYPQAVINKNTFFINGISQGDFTIPEVLLSWPLDDNVNDSYDYFVLNLTYVQGANYNLNGSVDDTGFGPFTSGGIWRYFPAYLSDLTGLILFYDDELKFITIQSEAFIPEREFLDDYRVYQNQSLYDLAAQLYGDVNEGLKNMVAVVKELDRGGAIPQGTLLQRKVPVSSIGGTFNDEDVLISTVPLPPILVCQLNLTSTFEDKVQFERKNWINYTEKDVIEVTFKSRSTSGTQYAFSQGNNSYWRQRWGIGVKDGDLFIDFYTATFQYPLDLTEFKTVRLDCDAIGGLGGTVTIYVDNVQVGQLLGINTGLNAADFLVPVIGAYHNGGSGDHPSEGDPIIDSFSGYLDGSVKDARFNEVIIPINEGEGDQIQTSSNEFGTISTIHADGLVYINANIWDCDVLDSEDGLESGLEFSLIG